METVRKWLILSLLLSVVCFIFFVSAQAGYTQQQIATDTYAIFEQSCGLCHGPYGAFQETLLMEHNLLIEKESVIPGDPDASELYRRLVTTDLTKRMPLAQPALSAQAIETIRNWILAGAPDWAVVSASNRKFISPGDALNTIETHLMSLSSFDRSFARYFTLTHLYNADEPVGVLEEYRKGFNKLVNSLSWGANVTNPEPIDPEETILYIDLRHYEWDVNDGWGLIEAEYPYHIGFDAPSQTELKAQLMRLQGEMQADIPSIHADWFLATAALPPLYHELLDLPLTDRELETRLEVDVARNLQNAPGVRVWRAGTNNSGVSPNNRVIERHTSQHGAYWKSYDFAGSVGTQNIFNHPLAFTHDGGEVIFNLPNGLQGYYITNATGSRLDAAPISIVSNPAASDPTVRNGLSCFGCHTEGMKAVADQVRPVIVSNTNPTYDKAQALRLYVEKSRMDALIAEDMERYSQALEATGGAVDDIEPIARFHEAFQGEVDAEYAAAVVGLETEAFLEKIRENIGLQNAGLLVLDSPNGSMKRDAWRSNFPAIIYALDFPDEQVDSPSQPDQPPGTIVRIPDTNLRAAIAEALGKSPNAPITVEEMERLGELDARNKGIQDLTGLQFAINLQKFEGESNQISDISLIAGLTNLRFLKFGKNPVSDISPVRGLTNLTEIYIDNLPVSDLSPLAGLINLKKIHAVGTPLSDLSPIVGLPKLETLYIPDSKISDLTLLASFTGLKILNLGGYNKIPISDISPLAGLTNLEWLILNKNEISDISPLAGLTNLEQLDLQVNKISDISPLAGLTNLRWIRLDNNNISDISPLAGLTHLRWTTLDNNNISDISPLAGLRENIKLTWYNNPGFPKGGPKIEGPWLWIVLPDTEIDGSKDLLSGASGGMVTEVEIATHGATEGKLVGDAVWTSRRLLPIGDDNIGDMFQRSLGDGVIYGSVSLYSPREQETAMYAGSDDELKVWLNGTLIHEGLRKSLPGHTDYQDFFTVTLQEGINVLLVAMHIRYENNSAFFGFEPGTEYTVTNAGVGYTLSPATIHRDETFTLDIHARNVSNLMGWQFDIVFDRATLEAVDVTEGDFLKTGAATFFQSGSIDNGSGQITGLTAARLSTQGVSGTGALVKARFEAKASGKSEVTLRNLQFVSIGGDTIDPIAHGIRITVEGGLAMGDVNRDGQVSSLDLVLVAQQLGKQVPQGSPADVNADGVVNMLDLIIVAQAIGNTTTPAAPAIVDAPMVEAWIAQARLEDDGSLAFKQGIDNLQALLRSLIPDKTALLHNYPNPFNPETWIPYRLAEDADVKLTIYDANGQLVHTIDVGHRVAAVYERRSKAIYWDGRNNLGEQVASGVYFYHLSAGDYSQTRKMLILK